MKISFKFLFKKIIYSLIFISNNLFYQLINMYGFINYIFKKLIIIIKSV